MIPGFFCSPLLESITEKDKRRLQNTMAYGEEGAAMIEETPRPRLPQREVKPEPEVDRFDEGKLEGFLVFSTQL